MRGRVKTEGRRHGGTGDGTWTRAEKRTDHGLMVLLVLLSRLQGRLLGRLGLLGQRPMRGGAVAEGPRQGGRAVLGGKHGAVRRTDKWVLPVLVLALLVRAAVRTVQGTILVVAMERAT